MNFGMLSNKLNQFRNLTHLASVLTGILIGLSLALVFQFQAEQSLLSKQDQQYGKALVTLAARQAIDATLNHDLVSLQVILRDIIENPRVANATIHDIENHLLVQAGSTPNLGRSPTLTFTAPIIFHESIAGYLSLAISPNNHAPLSQGLLALIVLALAALGITLFKGWNKPLLSPPPPKSVSIPIVDMPIKVDLPASNKTLHHVELDIHLFNVERLQRQLNFSRLKNLLDDFNDHIMGVTQLYKGESLGFISPSCLRLRFSARDIKTARLNAVCAANLLTRLQTPQSGITLQVSSIICKSSLLQSIEQQIQLADNRLHLNISEVTIGTTLIHLDLCEEDEQLPFSHHPLNSQWTAVTQLNSTYQDLLDGQLQQLQHFQLS